MRPSPSRRLAAPIRSTARSTRPASFPGARWTVSQGGRLQVSGSSVEGGPIDLYLTVAGAPKDWIDADEMADGFFAGDIIQYAGAPGQYTTVGSFAAVAMPAPEPSVGGMLGAGVAAIFGVSRIRGRRDRGPWSGRT